jgi:hypothetical protein
MMSVWASFLMYVLKVLNSEFLVFTFNFSQNIDISSVLIASHNQKSIEFATEQMRTRNLPTDRVFFGQLLGMADHLTFILGANGFKAYKYVPCMLNQTLAS